ncbi:putative phage protein [Vibrio cholerae]|nr:putative phage protein [Vibrio cholerae]
MKKIKISALLFSVALAGCASSPVSHNEAKLIDSDRIISNKYSKPRENSSTVIVKRDKGFMGSACSSRVYINAVPLVDIDPGEYYEFYLNSGNYIISAAPNGICSGGMYETQINIEDPKTLKYRIGYGTNGDYFIVPTAF